MQFGIKTASAMQKLGSQVAAACKPGCVIYLHGELGAGKTTWVRGFLHELGHKGHVRSPTFTLMELYRFKTMSVYHFDLYRLINPEEFMYIGGRDYFTQEGVCLIEWPERGKGFLPPADLICNFEFGVKGNGRTVQLIARSDKGKVIISQLKYENAKV